MTAVTLDRNCEHCGVPFTPKRSTARFHSDACRTAHGRGQRHSEPNANGSLSRLAMVTAIRMEPLTWDPPSEPRRPYETTEPCPECGGLLHASPRDTARACLACRRARMPAAVRAPYEHQPGSAQRRVVPQRERDLEAIALVRRKGLMLDQLGRLAAEGQLHPESAPVVEWFAGEVRAARSGDRLDDLAELLPESGIRRRRWWQGQLTEAETAWDDDDQDDDDALPARPPLAIAAAAPARPAEPTWEWALSAIGWHVSPIAGGCEVIDDQAPCRAEVRHHVGKHHGADTWVCDRHYQALCRAINDARKPA